MASATKKASSLTTLKIGTVEVAVGLFSTVASPSKLTQFSTAGPSGGRLKVEHRARPVPVDEVRDEGEDVPVGSSDPFADEPPRGDAVHTGLAEMLMGPSAPMDPAGPGPGMERDTWEHVPSDEEPAPVKPDEPEPGSREDFDQSSPPHVHDVVPGGMLGSPSQVVDGEYGRVLVEEGTGVVVLQDQVRHGVRLDTGSFVDCTAQLAKIEQDTQLDRMEVIGFVDGTQIPRVRVKAAHYLGAGDETAPRALRIMYEALKATRRMAVAKLTKRSRQTLAAIGVSRGCLVLLELVWAEDFREPPARATSIQKAQVTEREVAMFIGLVQAKSVPVSALGDLRDDAIARREELYALACSGGLPEEVVDAEVVDPADELIAQLEASLAAAGS